MKRYNHEQISTKFSNKLDNYVGSEITNSLIEQIQNDLNLLLNKYITDHEVYTNDFPIEFTNEFGRWRIEQNGDCFFQPITQIKKINITIKL